MTTNDLPDAAGAFTLSVAEAARLLKVTPTQLLDLCKTGFVYYCVVPASATAERPPLRFAPGLLAEAAELLERRMGESQSADAVMVSTALRAYLTEKPPLDDYEMARSTKAPVLAKNRAGEVYAHVQIEVLTEQVCNRQGFMLPSRIRAALNALGAYNLKSLHGLSDGRQYWHSWWRVPQSFWRLDDDQVFRLEESVDHAMGVGP